jgi:two-component system, NtrC family, sensor kinase
VVEALRQYHSLGRMLVDDGADEQQLNAQLGKTAALSGEIVAAGLLEETTALFTDTLFGVDQIKDLVINLRNFSRLDQSRVAAVSLNDCLDQTLSIANNLIKGRVSVIRRYGELPLVSCSPSQINQVLLNLITNGVQAIEHDQGKLLLKTEAGGDWVRISVQDNGKGIAPEHLQKIFDPFFTTKPVGHGTGLGLSISYQIIQAHGGSIQVVSKPGQGTKFLVSLPLNPVMQEAA